MEYGNDFDFSYGVPDGPTMSSSGSDIFSVIMTVYLLVIVPRRGHPHREQDADPCH